MKDFFAYRFFVSAKCGKAYLWPGIVRKNAWSFSVFEKDAVRSEQKIFICDTLGNTVAHFIVQRQDENKIPLSDDVIDMNVSAADSFASIDTFFYDVPGCGKQIILRLSDFHADPLQPLAV